MLDIRLFRENPEVIRQNLKKRKDDEKLKWVDIVIEKDKKYRELLKNVESLRHERNKITEEINNAKKQGKEIKDLVKKAKELPEKIKNSEEEINKLKSEIKYYLMRMPNIIHESVPYGIDDSENVEIKRVGKIKEFGFELKPHQDIIENFKMGNFKKAAEVSGAGFYYLIGDFALLDQALQQFAISLLVKKGYKLVEPPFMLRRKAYEGVTDLADFENVMYKIENEDLYLIATSEHPIAALYMNEVVDSKDLPIKLIGTSACFRKEIGSHGVDTRGLFRVHQFNKIEQFIFCRPEESWKYFDELIGNAEEIFKQLEIPYRVVNICTGDLGIVASKKYDLEIWMPREKEYKEAVSCSNCTAYQAVRLNIKYSDKGKKEYLHTLNSTAIATGRVIRSIIENFQNKDGSITIPKVLRPYMFGKEKIVPEKQ